MNLAFWILGLLLILRGATDVETQGNAPNRVLRFADDSTVVRDKENGDDPENSEEESPPTGGPSVADIVHQLVKHETLVQQGAVVFSKTHVQNYSALLIDAVEHADRKPGIYVGAMNWLIKFNLSLEEIVAVNISSTVSNEGENATGDVGNFIRKLHMADHDATPHLVVCGTNSSSPGCSWRLATDPTKEINYFEGLFPSSPRVGLASHMWRNEVVVGTALDPEGKIGTIVRATLKHGSSSSVLNTMDNEYWLNNAEFVGAFSTSQEDKYVYVVFREIAVEAPEQNTVFSRVARICKDDEGGLKGKHQHFGSFIKAHIHCMEFLKVTAIYYVDNSRYLWATFTSNNDDVSAVCNFEMSKLESVFRGSYSIAEEGSNENVACPPPYIFKNDTVVETCFGLRSEKAVKEYIFMYQPISGSCDPINFPDSTLRKIAVVIRNPASPFEVTVFVSDEIGQILKVDVDNCAPVRMQIWEAIPKSGSSSKEINDMAVFNDSIVILTNENVLKIPIKHYPGTTEESTTATVTNTTAVSPSVTGQARALKPTYRSKPSHQSEEFPNKLLTLFMMIYLAFPGF